MENNKYSQMQKAFYEENVVSMKLGNHSEHDSNVDYWDILIGDIKKDKFNDCIGLDFGCGCGRNLINIHKISKIKRIDGIDISSGNIEETRNLLIKNNISTYALYVNNGIDLQPLKDNEYDFVMSTIVFQHICVHEIRYSIMKDVYRVMKEGGLFSFQMGFGNSPGTVGYFENFYDASSTNSDCDVRIENPEDLVNDLKKIGFKDITYVIKPSWSNIVHSEWIYVKAFK